MITKRNLTLLAIGVFAVALLAVPWSIVGGDDYDDDGLRCPGGIYTGLLRSPAAEYIITMTIIPMDPAGNRMIFIARTDNSDPTFGTTAPPSGEADHLSDYVGNMVRTDRNTWDYTGIAYGTKKVEPPQLLPEILYMDVPQGTLTSTEDGNTLTAWGSSAYYLPLHDVDGDGFPDAGQEPIYCSPPGPITMTRIPIMPPCVPTPP